MDYLGGHFELKLSEESDWRQRELIKVLAKGGCVSQSPIPTSQSTTAIYSIPEIGLESARAGSCAKLTVLELLMATRMELGKAPSFDSGEDHGDSMLKLSEFIERLDDIITGSLEATLILQDPRQKMCFIEVCGHVCGRNHKESTINSKSTTEKAERRRRGCLLHHHAL